LGLNVIAATLDAMQGVAGWKSKNNARPQGSTIPSSPGETLCRSGSKRGDPG
jgi:hypothetical protein